MKTVAGPTAVETEQMEKDSEMAGPLSHLESHELHAPCDRYVHDARYRVQSKPPDQ